jgi:transposase
MPYKYHIGIDVSKHTLDVTLLKDGDPLLHERIDNTKMEIRKFLKRMSIEQKIRVKNTLFCIERSGTYTELLLTELTRKKLSLWLESPLQIKLSLGLQRGKNDKLDSLRIARYAYTFWKKIKLWERPREIIEKLKKLRSLRHRLLTARIQLKAETKEIKGFVNKELSDVVSEHCRESIDAVVNDILKVDETILDLIKTDERCNQLFKIISSVPGVGNVLATEFLILTNEFRDFSTSKRFACYCGVAPFHYSSGIRLRSKGKVSNHGNKRMKSLLHIAAMSSIRGEGDYKSYFDRRVAEGKNKMSVLNVIRNKIIHRVFACVRDGREYSKEAPIIGHFEKNFK